MIRFLSFTSTSMFYGSCFSALWIFLLQRGRWWKSFRFCNARWAIKITTLLFLLRRCLVKLLSLLSCFLSLLLPCLDLFLVCFEFRLCHWSWRFDGRKNHGSWSWGGARSRS